MDRFTFYDSALNFAQSLIAGLIFILALFSRPLGGLIFGYLGDRFGRKFSLVLSIAIISLSSFSIAAMQFSLSWGIYIIFYIGVMKFIQGIPAGGEIPAATCLIAESSPSETRRRYLCSFVLIGPQIGQIISMIQCLVLETYFSHEFLIRWGWRISFIIAGVIGFIGVILRSRLHESSSFKRLQASSKVLSNPIAEIFKHYKKQLLLAFFISIFEVTGFFMTAFFIVEHFTKIFDLSPKLGSLINILFLIPILFIQPLMGKLGERHGTKPLSILSAIAVLLVSFPFYLSVSNSQHLWSLLFLGILIVSLCIQFALIPSILADIFPSSIRFTGIGFSFNMCNSIIGSLVPFAAWWLIKITGNPALFIIIYPLSAISFLLMVPFIPTPSSPND